MTAKKKKAGRKSKYDELEIVKKLDIIEMWVRDGMTEKSIQESLGVGHTTFNEWKHKHPEFKAALQRGREHVLALTENALYKRAWGFTTEEVETVLDEDGAVSQTRIKRKEVLPDTTSIIFALKNLAPDKWRDRREIANEHSFDLNQMSDAELEAELAKLGGDLSE